MPRTAIALALALAVLALADRPAAGATLEDHAVRYFCVDSVTAAAAEVAILRAAGQDGISAIDAARLRDDPRLRGVAWDPLYDAVGQQRGCRTSHLYWYTDLAAAEAAARAQGKPIVSVRLLGRLTDEYSCANSRFFRAILYSDQEVSAWLREHVILHWSSERPVPQVAIDFGDGRVLRTTLTGNSAHYLLDADGRPVDVLPGLYGPKPFLARLQAAAACAAELREQPARRAELLAAFHRAALDHGDAAKTVMYVPVEGDDSVVAAEQLTESKSRGERPLLRAIAVYDDRLTPQAAGPARAAARFAPMTEDSWGEIGAGGRAAVSAQLEGVRALLGGRADSLEAMLARVEHGLARDTKLSEFVLHAQIHQRFAEGREGGFSALNAWVYAEVFRTPASDPWLGLLPAAYDGLAHLDVGTTTAAR